MPKFRPLTLSPFLESQFLSFCFPVYRFTFAVCLSLLRKQHLS